MDLKNLEMFVYTDIISGNSKGQKMAAYGVQDETDAEFERCESYGSQVTTDLDTQKNIHAFIESPDDGNIVNGTEMRNNTDLSNQSASLPFVCGICDVGFKLEKKLLDHVKQHMGNDSYKCEICGKMFPHKKNLSQHTKLHTSAPQSKQFSCEVCEKVFSRKHSLTIHLRMHTGEQPYICTICRRAFNRKDILDKHIKTHVEKVFICEICNKRFDRKAHLTSHAIIHTGEGLLKQNGLYCKNLDKKL